MAESSKRLSREEYVENILLFLHKSERPSHNLKDIADAVGVSQATISGYVLYALASEYVVEQHVGPSKAYYLTDAGRKKVEEILAEQDKKKE